MVASLSINLTTKAGFFMKKQEIIDDIVRLHRINQTAIAEQFRRLKDGLSKSGGNLLVQAINTDLKLLITIAKLEGHIDPETDS